MRIGIVNGLAESAKLKAVQFYDGILASGSDAKIFSRIKDQELPSQIVYSNNDQLLKSKEAESIDFFISCTETATEVVSALNKERGYQSFNKKDSSKANLHKLSKNFSAIKCYKTLAEVPVGQPIFIKPEYGTGSTGSAPWAYKSFSSVEDFKNWLNKTFKGDGLSTWRHAQKYPGLLGRYIIQELTNTTDMIGVEILNDGSSTPWIRYEVDNNHGLNLLTNKIIYGQSFDVSLEEKIHPGHFGAFQFTENNQAKPILFDFNTRLSARWSSIYQSICPNFFRTFFHNFITSGSEKYDFKCESFIMTKQLDDKEHGVIVRIFDYPASDKHEIFKLILK